MRVQGLGISRGLVRSAAWPNFGNVSLYFTVGIAIIATFSGVVASLFAVSRMTAMLTDMKLMPR